MEIDIGDKEGALPFYDLLDGCVRMDAVWLQKNPQRDQVTQCMSEKAPKDGAMDSTHADRTCSMHRTKIIHHIFGR